MESDGGFLGFHFDTRKTLKLEARNKEQGLMVKTTFPQSSELLLEQLEGREGGREAR